MSEQFEAIQEYPTLTDAQRIQARDNARRNIVAKHARKPERSAYNNFSVARYPRWFTLPSGILFASVALAAGTISAFRLYYAGYNAFYASVPNHTLAVIVGVLTPVAAELMVIGATVMAQVYLRSWSRLLALLPVATGMVVAFVGNWEIAQPSSAWGWVETVFPPVAVLSVALLFEVALLPEIERRQENESAFREARDEYDILTERPEQHRAWANTYGAALWEMWARVYAEQYDRNAIDRDTRRALALREMAADLFFDDEIAATNRKLQKASPENMVSQTEVIAYLKANPDAETLKQSEIADLTGASPATVSRAFKKFISNGHGERGQ